MDEPVTDVELTMIEHMEREDETFRFEPAKPGWEAKSPILRVVAEVRRLRVGWSSANEQVESMGRALERLSSDEWLEKAAEEIEHDDRLLDEMQTATNVRAVIVAILRKHRDEKA